MCYFLLSYYDSYWDRCCEALNKPNDVSSHSGVVSYHMLVIYYCMHKDITSLSNNYKNEEALTSHVARERKKEGETK